MHFCFLPTFKMVLICMTENKFLPTSELCNSLLLLATYHMDMVSNVHTVFNNTAIYKQFEYLSEGTNKNSVKNLLIILFLEQTDSPVAILHSCTA